MLVVVYAFINDCSFPLDFVKLCCVDLCYGEFGVMLPRKFFLYILRLNAQSDALWELKIKSFNQVQPMTWPVHIDQRKS